MEAAVAGTLEAVAQQDAAGEGQAWREMYAGLPARRDAVRAVESAFLEKVMKDGPPVAKLDSTQQERLKQHISSASSKMESAVSGILMATADAERLAHRVANEKSVVMEEVFTHIQDIRTLLSETPGDIVMFSNLGGLMIQANNPLSLYPDVQEASQIVYEQLDAARDVLISISATLMQNSVSNG